MTNFYEDNFKQKESERYARHAKENVVINPRVILEKAMNYMLLLLAVTVPILVFYVIF